MNNSEAVKRYLGSEAALALELLRNTQARRGVNAGAIDDYLVPPVLAPSVPSRFYYLFKQPIFLSPEMAKDRDQCAKVYDTVKHQVEASLAYLVKKREVDPYRDFFRRMAHEMLSGEQAPTFRP